MLESQTRALVLEGVDRQELVDQIATEVVKRLRFGQSASDRLVDRAELSELISLSPSKITELVNEGLLPSIKLDRRRLYRPSAVIAALESIDNDGEPLVVRVVS